MTCYVYLIVCNPKKTRPYVKIGMADDPQKRIDTLQTGNPYELRTLACIPCKDRVEARHLEAFMHKKLCASRVRGEWFKTNGGNLNSQLLEMAKMKGIPDLIDATKNDDVNSSQRAAIRRLNRTVRNLKKENAQMRNSNKFKPDSKEKESVRKLHKKVLMEKLVSMGVSYREIMSLLKDAEANH